MEQYEKAYLYRRLVQAKLFIDRHYAERIDLHNIANEAYFSKFHFIRLFKSTYRQTPHHYLRQVRIDKAKGLLTQGVSVAEACYAVGFESVTSFAGLFKQLVGATPTEFQRRQQTRHAAFAATPLRFIPNCFAEGHGWAKNRNFQELPR
jgi:AraC-like DNA-binding protein